MKCRVRILIVSVVVGFILKYNHYYYYYYYHPYQALNNPNPKTEVCPNLSVVSLKLILSLAQKILAHLVDDFPDVFLC